VNAFHTGCKEKAESIAGTGYDEPRGRAEKNRKYAMQDNSKYAIL
jgi:hypothetical protein